MNLARTSHKSTHFDSVRNLDRSGELSIRAFLHRAGALPITFRALRLSRNSEAVALDLDGDVFGFEARQFHCSGHCLGFGILMEVHPVLA
jgi:hypothetical protein